MPILLEELRREHRNTARLLDALEHQIAIAARAGQPDYQLILGIADYICEYLDRCHHVKETAIYQQLRAKYPWEAKAVGDLGREHAETQERVTRFRQLVYALIEEAIIPRSALVDAARVFIEAERRHMRKEEDHIFPVAEKCLGHTDWIRIRACLAKERGPELAGLVEEEFAELSKKLLAWEKDYTPGA